MSTYEDLDALKYYLATDTSVLDNVKTPDKFFVQVQNFDGPKKNILAKAIFYLFIHPLNQLFRHSHVYNKNSSVALLYHEPLDSKQIEKVIVSKDRNGFQYSNLLVSGSSVQESEYIRYFALVYKTNGYTESRNEVLTAKNKKLFSRILIVVTIIWLFTLFMVIKRM